MVVDAQRPRGERVAAVAHQARRAAVEDDGQRAVKKGVRHIVGAKARQRRVPAGAVADHAHLFLGIIFQQDVPEADLAAQRVAVRVFVAVQDDAVVPGDHA